MRVLRASGLIAALASAQGSPDPNSGVDGVMLMQQQVLSYSTPASNASHEGQSVHWIFTTDCSANMFNQGNVLLASALHVGQPGNFTWIMSGCNRKEQISEATKLAHPMARVFHVKEIELPKDPKTGRPYPAFQASNRPTSINAWFKAVQPTEEAIAIIDPDEVFMRQVRLMENPRKGQAYNGPWEAQAVSPKHGSGAYYGIGCILNRWTDGQIKQICDVDADKCLEAKHHGGECSSSYSSGPPWIIHRSDAGVVFAEWAGTAVRVHQVWNDIFSEQAAYGISQAQFGVKSSLDPFWFLSSTDDPPQQALWSAIANAGDYDPCREQKPPPSDFNFPPFWHACLTYEIPHLKDSGFRLHKDHIHKDLLDCDAPLLHHPPLEALEHYGNAKSGQAYRQTWAVCTYTNLVNFHAKAYKGKFCEKPNLEATFSYPPHSQSFLNPQSRLMQIFRKGGWSDVDYKVSF